MGEAQEISNEPTVIIEHTQYIHPGARSYKVVKFYYDVYSRKQRFAFDGNMWLYLSKIF